MFMPFWHGDGAAFMPSCLHACAPARLRACAPAVCSCHLGTATAPPSCLHACAPARLRAYGMFTPSWHGDGADSGVQG